MNNYINRKSLVFLFFQLTLYLVWGTGVAKANIPEPIFEYLFNETGVYALSSGSDKTSFVMKDNMGAIADLHTEGGLGVSGSLNDRAFDNYSWCEPSKGGVALHEEVIDEIPELKSFTFQGWYKVDQNGLRTDARLCAGPFGLYGWFGNALDFQVGAKRTPSAYQYTARNEWVFFAVTYDSTKASDNVNFYVGTKQQKVKLVSTHTNKEVVSKSRLFVGAIDSAGSYPFYGYLDNIRIFGSKKNQSGVLPLDELDAIRIGDIVLIADPELTTIERERSIGLTGLDEKEIITIHVVDMFGSNISNQTVLLEKKAGSIDFRPIEKKTDQNGEVIFEVSSLESGNLVLVASIFPGHGLPPVILREQEINIRFE